jgi:hypothetical protein
VNPPKKHPFLGRKHGNSPREKEEIHGDNTQGERRKYPGKREKFTKLLK